MIVLWAANRAQDGFRLTLSENHYAWTYGPTALLVVIVSLWRQVDFFCKTMQPWHELRHGSAKAQDNVLLDYVSPPNYMTFLRAMKRNHTAVASSIAAFALLKLIILLSTGLLVLSPTLIDGQTPITLTTRFDPNAVQLTTAQDLGLYYDSPIYRNLSGLPLQTYAGMLEGNVSDPVGTLGVQAFQSFALPSNTPANNVTAVVDVFNPRVSCEIAKTTLSADSLSVQLESSTCPLGPPRHPINAYWNDCGGCAPQRIEYDFMRVNCSGNAHQNLSAKVNLDATVSFDLRYALVVHNVTYKPINYSASARTVQKTSAVICKIDYSIDRSNVSFDYPTNSFMIGSSPPGARLQNFTNLMLGEVIFASIEQATNLKLNVSKQREDNDFQFKTPLYYVLVRTLQGQQSLDQLLVPETLQQASTQALSGISAQFFQQRFLQPAKIDSIASRRFTEARLHVTASSIWTMLAGFLLLSMLALYIGLSVKGDLVPQNPTLISNTATVLAASPSMRELLRHAGSLRTGQLTRLLGGCEFRSVVGERFTVEGVKFAPRSSDDVEVKIKKHAWHPMTGRWYFIIATFISPILMVIALEIVYLNSRDNSGIADVTGTEDRASAISHYFSALLMLLVATCYNNLDFTIATFAPYSMMRSGAVPADRSVRFQVLGELPFVALWKSISLRHSASALSNLAGLVGSVLTIVVSGLWVIDRSVISAQPIQASLAHTWNVSWYNSSSVGDGGAAYLLDRIDHGSDTLPNTIWDNYVLPIMSNITTGNSPMINLDASRGSQNFTFEVDALQAVLACEIVADEHIRIDFKTDLTRGDSVLLGASPPLPPGCRFAGPNGTNSSYYFETYTNLPKNVTNPQWSGAFYDLHLGPYYSGPSIATPGFSESGYSNSYQRDNPAGCPSIGVIYGRGGRNMTRSDVTALMCSQKVQQSTLRIGYTKDGRPVVDNTAAPVVISGSSRFLTNGTDGIDTFPYRPEQYLAGDFSDLTYIGEHLYPFDEFIDHVVHGPNGTSPADLAGVANRNTFIQAVERFYARYMSLVIDAKFRQPLSASSGGFSSTTQTNLVRGTVATKGSRLQMDRTSKIILQVLLATMTVFGLVAFLLMDLRGTLPRKPTTIASVVAFLADSDFCSPQRDLLPTRAEWLSEGEMDRLFHGWLFSMGWWPAKKKESAAQRDSCEDDGDSAEEFDNPAQAASHSQKASADGKRFGVDVGIPEQLGYRETRWWKVRRRVGQPWARIRNDS
jgi:hypothetical protein